MEIRLISKEQYDILTRIYNENKGLFLQNEGYEYINKDKLSNEDKGAFNIVTDILREHIIGFSEFNNFKLSSDNRIRLRFQYEWTADERKDNPHFRGIPFTGVGYILLDELLNGFEETNK